MLFSFACFKNNLASLPILFGDNLLVSRVWIATGKYSDIVLAIDLNSDDSDDDGNNATLEASPDSAYTPLQDLFYVICDVF